MKLSQEDIDKYTGPTASQNRFTKLADFKVPDSPPPEEEKEDDDPNAPSKFDQLMRAACSIKTHQLESQRKKFELMPTFLKSGVYYTTKHEVVRQQETFDIKMLVYELIRNEGNDLVAQGKYDRACHKYEEALGVWRYFAATDPDWQEKGIDDDKLEEINYMGVTEEQKELVYNIKLNMYLNIAACSIKKQEFKEAVLSCEEAIALDPNNIRAFYRRARATALPINAGVPELRKATKDLEKVLELCEE